MTPNTNDYRSRYKCSDGALGSGRRIEFNAQTALDAAFARGKLVIGGAVFAEMLALPRRTEKFIEEFLSETGIGVDWVTDEAMWRMAGRAFQAYANRRRKQSRVNLGDCWPTS